MRIREVIALLESARPSPELLEAVRSWVSETTTGRDEKTTALLSCRAEASRFLAPSYRALYRGQPIRTEQWDEFQKTGSTTVPMPRLASWTASRGVAGDYAEGFALADDEACSVLLAIPGPRLTPFLDLRRIARTFSRAEIERATASEDYWLHDMAREAEIIIEHAEPLRIHRGDVQAIHGLAEL
jgi:hypothetical protein